MQLITVSSGHTSPRYTDEWGMLMSSPRARRDSKEKKNGRHGSRSKSKPTSRGMLSEIRSVGKKGERKNQSSGVPKPLQIFMKNLKVCAQDEIRVTGKGSPEHGSSDLIKKIICNKGTTKQVKQNVSSSLQTSKRRSKEKLKKTQEESEKTQTSSLASPLFLNTVRTPLLKQKTHDSLVLGKVKKPLKMLEGRTFTNELKITDFSPLESKRKKTMSKSPQPGSRYNEPLMPKLSSIRAKKSRKQIDKKGQSKLKSSKKTKNSLKNRLLKKGFGNYGLPSQEECRSGGLQRHYLLNQPGPMNMKFLGQEDDSQTARDTIKVDFASKYECLGEQSLGDKTCKMFNMEVPTVENYFQKKTAPEEARAAERIQKFYLEWNEKEDVNSNNKPLTKSGLIKSVVENSKEDVKPPTDGGSSARANLIHSTSSNMDKNVSLCLSYTKYGMKKEERGQLTEDNTSSNAKKKLKAVTSFEGLGQRPDIFRSISKIVKSAKKSKLASKSKDSSTSSKNSNEKIILPTDLNFNKKITERKTSPGVGELILNIDDGRKLKPPSVPRINLDGIDTFAKAEYCKWTKVTNILQTIEKKMGGKAADEIQLLFKQLEAFAEVSKKNVKDAFFPQDSIPSGLVSELGTFRQDSSQRGNSFFERKMAIKRPVAAEGLPCGTTGEPAPEFEAKSSLEYGDSPQMSKSGAEFTRRSKGVALERWVDHSVLIRSSSSSRLIESKTIAM